MSLNEPLDDELRGILTNLAEGLFPLSAWIKEKEYVPKTNPHPLPWRQPGESLSPAKLGVVPFFEGLLRETSGDAELLARWKVIQDEPLKFNPLPDPKAWREQRGLKSNPGEVKFGAKDSANVLLDAANNQIDRPHFYASYWAPLKQTAKAVNPQNADGWQKLALDLFNDQCPQWPAPPVGASSVFVKQFAKDLLYAMVGMRNPAPPPWKFALLIELGEHRRVGNKYTPADVQVALKQFQALLK